MNTVNAQTSERIVRFGRVLGIIAKVFIGIICVAAAACIVGMIVFAVTPESAIAAALAQNGYVNANIFGITYGTPITELIDLPNLLVMSGAIKIAFIILFAVCLVYCAVTIVILLLLGGFFKAIAVNKTPFLDENVKRLKTIGIILIIASLLLGMTNLIVALSVLALAYVFQYGTELQHAADETL